MKIFMARTWAICMLLVITVSSSGLAMNQHLCGGKVKSKAVILHADKCDFEKTPICQKKNHESKVKKIPCCQDQHTFLKQVLDTEINTIDFQPYNNLVWISIPATWDFHSEEKYTVPTSNYYRPPPLTQDIPVLLQTFLL